MTEPTPPHTPASDGPSFVPPLAGGASYQPPTMPDITDLVEGSKGRTDKPATGSGLGRTVIIGGVIGAVVIAGAGFLAGRATSSGPKTLAEAFTQAQAGTFPCGDSTGAGGGFISRICGGGAGTGTGAPNPGASGGPAGGFGGFGGRGVVGTVTAVSATSITVDTRGGSVTVAVPSGVTVSKTVAGAMSDVTVGSSVTVASTTDTSGNRTASRIAIVPAGTLPGGDGGPAPQPSSS